MDINLLQDTDLPSVEHIAQACFSNGAWSTKQYLQSIESERSVAIGLFAPDLVGYIIFSKILDEGELLQVAIDPAQQGCGFAQQLIAHGIEMLRTVGVKRVMLEVRESNSVAIAVYKKMGFLTEGLRKNYYPPVNGTQREHAVLMGLAI